MRRAGVDQASVIVQPRPHHHGVAGQRDVDAQLVTHPGVRGGELGLLSQHPARADEDVRGARVGPARVVVIYRRNHRRVTGEVNRMPEQVAGCGIGGGQLGLLSPYAAGKDINVGRPRVDPAPVVIAVCPDQHRVPGQRHSGAKLVARPCVGGYELEVLGQDGGLRRRGTRHKGGREKKQGAEPAAAAPMADPRTAQPACSPWSCECMRFHLDSFHSKWITPPLFDRMHRAPSRTSIPHGPRPSARRPRLSY